jgi:hypothetical protein
MAIIKDDASSYAEQIRKSFDDYTIDRIQKQNEMLRGMMEDTVVQGSSIKPQVFKTHPILSPAASAAINTGAYITSNAGQSWYGHTALNAQVMANCKGKMVVDIGVIENGACITFDDFSMLEIVAATSKVDLKETSHLNLLNGLQLDDIVTTVHQSLYTNWVGVLSIYAVNGWKLDFKIMSQDVPSVGPFHLELKVNNAVR